MEYWSISTSLVNVYFLWSNILKFSWRNVLCHHKIFLTNGSQERQVYTSYHNINNGIIVIVHLQSFPKYTVITQSKPVVNPFGDVICTGPTDICSRVIQQDGKWRFTYIYCLRTYLPWNKILYIDIVSFVARSMVRGSSYTVNVHRFVDTSRKTR